MIAPEAFTVRLLTQDGTPAGIGVLVADRHILTCAHVVNGALGHDGHTQEKPDATVTLDFPLLPRAPQVTARVDLWLPPPRQGAAGDDIAGLEITGTGPPQAANPVRLAVDPARAGTQVRVFGCPRGRPDGRWVEATIQGSVLGSRIQLESHSAERVEQGFSGSPVFDEGIGQVVGLIALAPTRATERDSYAIAAERLRQAWPRILGGPRRRDPAAPEITILHLPGPRFGSASTGRANPGYDSLADDLAKLAAEHDVLPDLIVVCGDLTEHALPSEYRQAVGYLTTLAATAGIPRRHVVIVPGTHDVNRKACQAYFAEQESREAEPVPPYFPKWNQFADAFREFYADVSDATFTPDEPWTLFPMLDLGVVVAGLNSTMAMTHREEDGRGELGEAQLNWFAERLAGDYRITIAAVHHESEAPIGQNLTLQAAAAGGYQLLTIRPDGLARYQRAYDAQASTWTTLRWAEHTPRFFEFGSAPRLPSTTERDDFFAHVAEATRVRYQGAAVSERPEEGYLRITFPRPGGITEQWPVGVIRGPATERAVRDFANGVHAQFASRDPQVPSELVHDGPAADASFTRMARQRGIRLRSLIEYQGLLDLRPLAQAQYERLATDRIYAERLYVPQRFHMANDRTAQVRHGLIEQAVDWLSADNAQMVVVLGDFGRGKTSFLRQLARTLPAELPSLLPILVELRSLEKAPSLEALLVLHLASQGVQDINAAKLEYMVQSGRLALLFDGFDELELRVGYDNADEYLRILLASVTGHAKVVLTSRTQHFRSSQQVLTALGERVSGQAGSRVVLLEDFSADQIAEFLTKLYDGDQGRARTRLALIGDIGNLLDLAHNPRMLAFIAGLDDGRLRAVRDRSDRLTAADLYREIIDSWLTGEAERQAHRRGLPTLSKQERFDACTALALRLWASKNPTIALGDLSAEVSSALTGLAERGFTDEQASHSIGSGSLLVRTEDGAFAFVHQSVMEWLVAAAAATDPSDAQILASGRVSRLMADFYTDLAGTGTAREWAGSTLADDQATEVAKQNALTIVGSTGAEAPTVQGIARPRAQNLAGVDLRGQELSFQDLSSSNLHRTDLHGARLTGTNLRYADLTEADLRGARLTECDLGDARLSGSNWARAALLGTRTDESVPDLRAAAITGRDRVNAMIEPPLSAWCVTYSPDGSLLAIGSYGHIEILDTTDYRILRVIQARAGRVRSIAFSADGALLACAAESSQALVWDVANGELVTALPGPGQSTITCVAFSPIGRHLATGSTRGRADVWDVATGTLVISDSKFAPVHCIAFSPDGSKVAVGAAVGEVGVLDAFTGRAARRAYGTHRVTSVAFSPDGTLLAVGLDDGSTHLLDVASSTERATTDTSDTQALQVAFSPSGTLLATARGYGPGAGVSLWDLASPDHGRNELVMSTGSKAVTGIAFDPVGADLAIVVGGRQVQLLDPATGAARTIRFGDQPQARVEFTSGRALVATLGGQTCHWDADLGVLSSKESHQSYPETTFSPDGWKVAEAAGHRVTIMDMPNRSVAADLEGHRGGVNDLAFSSDGALLATASDDGTARVWDATGQGKLGNLTATPLSPRPVTAVAFPPNGGGLVTGGADGVIRLWDLTLTAGRRFFRSVKAELRELARLSAHAGPVCGLCFSAEGSLLVSVSADGTAVLWTGNLDRLATLTGHLGPVRAAAFSPDLSTLATAGEDQTVRIWNIEKPDAPEHLMTLLDLPDDGWATLLPDGRYRLHGDPGGSLWWAMKLCRFAPGELDAYVPGLTRLPDDAPL